MQPDDGDTKRKLVAWGGAILSPAAGTASGAFIVGAALLGGNVSGEAAALALAGQFYAFVVSGALAGIVMLGASVVILRTRVFSSWLGWAGWRLDVDRGGDERDDDEKQAGDATDPPPCCR